jgi:predicted Zn-dependent protease
MSTCSAWAAHLDERLFPYSVEVIATTASTEPMALPGGYVLIPARFFLAVEDEDEFAGVLAHSLGHIALRHATRIATRGEVAKIASIPILHVGGWMGSHADSQRPGISQPLAFLQFRRVFELEADAFGLELAARAGYPAAALRRYIERLQILDARFSPLPARDLRLARMEDLPQTGPGVPFYSPEEFLQIREMIRDADGPLEQAQQRPAPTLRR